jgi:hypothetical protein
MVLGLFEPKPLVVLWKVMLTVMLSLNRAL